MIVIGWVVGLILLCHGLLARGIALHPEPGDAELERDFLGIALFIFMVTALFVMAYYT